MSKVKVIEIVGQKLDPNAKYVFLVHMASMPRDEVVNLADALTGLIGNNFVIGFTRMPIDETMKVYEVLPYAKDVRGSE